MSTKVSVKFLVEAALEPWFLYLLNTSLRYTCQKIPGLVTTGHIPGSWFFEGMVALGKKFECPPAVSLQHLLYSLQPFCTFPRREKARLVLLLLTPLLNSELPSQPTIKILKNYAQYVKIQLKGGRKSFLENESMLKIEAWEWFILVNVKHL